jgi:hypothetical protein
MRLAALVELAMKLVATPRQTLAMVATVVDFLLFLAEMVVRAL